MFEWCWTYYEYLCLFVVTHIFLVNFLLSAPVKEFWKSPLFTHHTLRFDFHYWENAHNCSMGMIGTQTRHQDVCVMFEWCWDYYEYLAQWHKCVHPHHCQEAKLLRKLYQAFFFLLSIFLFFLYLQWERERERLLSRTHSHSYNKHRKKNRETGSQKRQCPSSLATLKKP